MSKKKVASRSAMTLKDFHGGSIPSDLPLPSAPGMTVDRSAFERQGSGTWMSPTLGRGSFSNDRSGYHRQGSSSGVRTLEDKASYFPNPANIGRNYDEDERKPVDSRPRSSHSADRFDDHSYEERRGGGYPAERYALEDQSSFSESRGSAASDRFPPSQVTGGGFEADIYVHDEFGLIPVGPPPRVLPPHDIPSRPQPGSYQRDTMAETRLEQSSYVQMQQQTPSAPPPFCSSQQIPVSPSRSWRNQSYQVQQISTTLSQVPAESVANVWTARRDGGDVNRLPTPEGITESIGSSSPWRPHSIVGRAVDKISSGRWQADMSRPSPGRWHADSSREPLYQKSSGAEEQGVGCGTYGADTARGQSYGEDLSEKHRSIGTDPGRVGHSEAGRGPPYVDNTGGHNVDDEKPDLIDQNKTGYRDLNRVGFGSTGVGGTLSNGPFRSDSAAQSVVDRIRYSEVRDGSLTTALETSQSSQSETAERPKLKLLPRSRPLEKVDTPNVESGNVVGYEESTRKVHGLSDNKQLPTENLSQEGVVPKREPGATNDELEESSRRVERPKLNLKPRSQPPEVEVADGSQKVRQLVFGGARPRELVLKERGADDVVNGALEGAMTPVTASLQSSGSFGTKLEPVVRIERAEIRTDERHESRRYERSERSYERQGGHHADRQDSGRADRGLDTKWDREKDSQWDQERPDGLRRREFERQDSRRDTDSRRDIDKQESWRRPAESPVSVVGVKSPGAALSSLVDPSPRGSARPGYGSTASAVELAQAFSRSSSIGSSMTGSARAANNLRSPLSPIPKSSVQGFSPGYGNGTASRDAPFSRLAEAPPSSFSANSPEIHLQSISFGLDSQNNYFGSGKLGGYSPTDLKRGSSFGRTESAKDLREENGDFPGKRGLPVRQRDGYFD